ncbi:MAG TPA: hypothetical protein VFS91_11435 [Nitrobacter sp.]|nr:hypothetical protein [Nitrobacter sp.]
MSVLLIAGIGVFVAGLVAVAFGIPVKEFSFGDTLIVSGAVVSSTGLIMISLWLVVRELRAVADGLRFEAVAADRGGDVRVPIPQDRDIERRDIEGRDIEGRHPSLSHTDQAELKASSDPRVLSPSWQVEMSARDRVAVGAVPDVAAPESPESSDTQSPPKPRRNLLFASSMRKERERTMTGRSGPAGLSPPAPATHAPDLEASRPASFDDTWRRSERSRPEPGRVSSAGTREDRASGLHGQNSSAVTVLRSGVVDGMAYSLYSDGTIEAQLPEGMMRFASIDQLREHLDRSSPK